MAPRPVQTVVQVLLAASVLLLPFNDSPYLRNWLGELAAEAAALPLVAAVAVRGITAVWQLRMPPIPRPAAFGCLLAFVAWCALATAWNLDGIAEVSFKGRSGLSKAVLQTGMLFVLAASPVVVTESIGSAPRRYLSRAAGLVLLSLVPALAYAALEVWAMLAPEVGRVVEAIDVLIREDLVPGVRSRIRSISGEPSHLAVYLAVAFPVTMVIALTRCRDMPRAAAVGLVSVVSLTGLLTYSRSVYGVLVAQFLVLATGTLLATRGADRRAALATLLAIAAIGCVQALAAEGAGTNGYAVTGVTRSLSGSAAEESSQHTVSNTLRGLEQRAALEIARAHPVVGVGLGQFAFHIPQEAIAEALRAENEELRKEAVRLFADRPGTPWPPVYNLYARLAAEVGVVGPILWLMIWATAGTQLLLAVRRLSAAGDPAAPAAVALLGIVAGLALFGLAHDSFRFAAYWLALGASQALVTRAPVGAGASLRSSEHAVRRSPR